MREATEAPTEQTEGEAPSRLLRTVLPLLVVGGLVVGHLEVLARGPSYAGPLLVVDHLFDLGMAVLVMAFCVAAGCWLLRALGLEPAGALPTGLHGSAVGAGFWSLALLVLGFAGLLEPIPLGMLGLLGSLWLRRELADLSRLGRDAVREIRGAVDDRWLLIVGVGITVAVGGFLVLHGSAPPADWDSLMYHLEIPRQWWARGRIHVPEGNLHVAYTGLLQTLYLPFLAVGSMAGPALLNGIFALALGVAVLYMGTRLFDVETGVYSALLLWASTGFLLVAITPRVDTTLAFVLLMSQGSVALAWIAPDEARTHLLRAAVLLGVAAGMKYHALAFGAAMAPLGLWVLWNVVDPANRVRVLWTALVLGLLGVLPWIFKNLILLGEPLYPFFTERILQPWLADLYGSRTVPDRIGSDVFGLLGRAREPVDLVSLFLAPERLTVEQEGVHYNLNPLLILLPVWLLHLRKKEVAAFAVPGLLYAGGVIVLLSTINLRYLFPALPGLTLVTTYFAVSAVRTLPGVIVRRSVMAIVVLVCLVPTARSAYAWTVKAPVLEQALGRVSAQGYLARGFGYYATLAGMVNRNVPPDGTVLLFWEARGFYLAPSHLPDNVLTNWPLLRPYVERTGSCLEGTGITHVLAAGGAARYYAQRGADPAVLGLEDFLRFADRCLDPVELGSGFALYRVPGGGSGGEAPSS